MNELPKPVRSVQRQDILVSVCLPDLPATEQAFATVRRLAGLIEAHFRFHEIILVADDATQQQFLPLVDTLDNCRLFAVRPGTGHYARRLTAAEEAIGDVVLLTAEEEVAHLDLLAMIEKADRGNQLVVAVQPWSHAFEKGLAAPLVALGHAAGFKVSPRDLKTVALPRTLLNQLLSHSDPELALRFPPRDPRIPIATVGTREGIGIRRDIRHLGRRLHMIQRILVYLAPGLLTLVALASALLALLGIGYALYAAGAWLVLDSLAPGWLTTSLMLSLTATFLGVSILGLSLGLQQLLSRQRDGLERVAHELNRVDLFGKVATDLNVDRDEGKPPSRDLGQ